MTPFEFMGQHPIVTFVLLVFAYEVIKEAMAKIVILFRGHPPASIHLTYDEDQKKLLGIKNVTKE